MNNEEAIARFIAVVALHFPRPKFNEDEAMEGAWIASMNRALGGFSSETIAAAAIQIVSSRKPKRDGRFFPVPAECVEICSEIQRFAQMAQRPLLAAPNKNEWSDDRLSLAFDLINCETGRRAAREGWVSALHTFCRKNMRLPAGPSEIQACVASGRAFDEALAKCHARASSPWNTALLALGEGFRKRRADLAGKVLVEVKK